MAVIIDDFEIDIAEAEEHRFDSEITEHPVETGADITDHVRSRGMSLTIDGIVSDTPIGAIAKRRLIDFGDFLPSGEAYAKLIGIRDARQPITIATSLRTYENMVMESLTIPCNATAGDALRFSAVFRQVQLITNERTIVLVSVPRGKAKVNRGQAFAPDVTAPAKTTDNATALSQTTGVLR